MRSIRRSLVLYFLGLMALALGAVSFLIDRVAGRTLESREIAAHQLIDRRYTELAREEREKFDAELNGLTSRIANDLQMQYSQVNLKEADRFGQHIRFSALGALSAIGNPYPLASPAWHQVLISQRIQTPLARQFFATMHLEELQSVDASSGDLIHVTVQASGQPDRVYRSRSLAGEKWDVKVPKFDAARMIDERFETRKLKDGAPVRVAEMKSPLFVYMRPTGSRPFFFFPGGGRGPRGDGQRPPESPSASRPEPTRSEPEPPSQVPFRTAYIQYGRSLAVLDAKLTQLDKDRQIDLDAEAASTASSRRSLRAWLGAIGLLTFVGLFGGGLLLVRRGLKPLDTLSDAVAKVSEKDFQLPVAKEQLSKELLPIHDRLTTTLKQLQLAFEHDKQAVADISHELRTPVAALLATLEVALRKPRDAEQYRQTLQECRGITQQMRGLVERVMTLASLDAEPTQVTMTEVDGVDLANQCAAVLRPLAETHGLSLTVNAREPVSVRTDPDKLREVLMNLLHNAVEYNRPGGNVELSVSNGGPRAVFAVKDTGIGMTDDVKARIFERFYRADPSRTATGKHAGLGLAIVKECVDRLGGRISVESTPGDGSQFKVELPVSA